MMNKLTNTKNYQPLSNNKSAKEELILIGKKYKLKVLNKDFYIDLLFYHLKLRSYVVIELKKGEFKPSYSGQIKFYCSVVDDVLAHNDDNPTIGLILYQAKDEIVAEYSLRNMSQPIGISEYELTEVLPKEFASSLPTIEMIEREFLTQSKQGE